MCLDLPPNRYTDLLVIGLISDFATRCFSISVSRHRRVNIKHPRPVHMERRILEAVTQSIYPQQLDDPGQLCSVIGREKRKSPQLEEALVQVENCTVIQYTNCF